MRKSKPSLNNKKQRKWSKEDDLMDVMTCLIWLGLRTRQPHLLALRTTRQSGRDNKCPVPSRKL
jgi:hypothetical protein